MASQAVGAVESSIARFTSPATPPVSSRHIPALDGLRAVAILLVLAHHIRFILEPSYPMERFTLWFLDGGWCGVELFFVLSGFLITGILLDSKDSSGFFKNFYARRALRIFPLYYGYIAVVFIGFAAWWSLHFHINPWKGVNPLWYLLYIENFKPHHMFNDLFLGHLWSLAIEEQFYLVWPLVVLVLSRSSLGFTCVSMMAAALMSRLFLAGHTVQDSFHLNTLTLASTDSLCAGALIALVIRNDSLNRRAKRWITFAAVSGALAFLLLAHFAGTLFLYSVPINTWGLTCLTLFFAGLVYWIVLGAPLLNALLSFRPLRAIGRVSYGMYVLHPLIIGLVLPKIDPVAPGTPAWLHYTTKLSVIVLLTSCTFLVALVSWQFWEKPFLVFKRGFQYRHTALTQPWDMVESTIGRPSREDGPRILVNP